jgi:hypothetical protein
MTVAVRPRAITPSNIPGWPTTPYNLISDTDAPIDSQSGITFFPSIATTGGPNGPDGVGTPAFWFTTTNTLWGSGRPGGLDEAADLAAAMNFNQIGIVSGPATNPDNDAPNPGSVVAVTVIQIEPQPDGSYYDNQLATTNIDLTNAVPGQMYWSAPMANPFQVWGSVYAGQPGMMIQPLYYYIAVQPVNDYYMYGPRMCSVRNGNVWGSSGEWPMQPGLSPVITNDNLYAGGVDLNLVNYQILGNSPLTPTVALTGRVLRRGELGSPPARLIPSVQLAGQPQRAGVLHGDMTVDSVTFNASTLSGGPLWKPAQLCTG